MRSGQKRAGYFQKGLKLSIKATFQAAQVNSSLEIQCAAEATHGTLVCGDGYADEDPSTVD